MNPQPQVITISDITPSLFNKLRLEHPETLSCPCSNTSVLYHIFVSNFITFHPICSSIFVSKEWIEALYEPMASAYFVMDFRTTAHAQFKFIADFCSLSKDIVDQTLIDLGDIPLFSIQLLSKDDVHSEVNKTVEVALSSSYTQVNLPLHFFQMITRSNSMASALNTNVLVLLDDDKTFGFRIHEKHTRYVDKYLYADMLHTTTCNLKNNVIPAGFYSEPLDQIARYHENWPMEPVFLRPIAVSTVDGFFGGCTALDAVLASTFDCLYGIKCLEAFTDYFPNLSRMKLNWTSSVLTSSRKTIPLNQLLEKLLIENRSIHINYPKYFNECAPSTLSLYGGLTIILRLIVPLLISLLLKCKSCPENTNFKLGIFIF
ncbi:unnamed protein product [Adineta steineri]|uniref:Uncharacterized protein n=1 Tax=Adineta steineri TaxID=433720 RepID=A0A818JBZ1_9BILA|nr:unnamed protein product [Adineta steineri]